MVEKVDPDEPSHGEVPGTLANEKRLADAVPDVVTKASDSEGSPTPPALDPTPPNDNVSQENIPETRLERVETLPVGEEASPHPQAHQSAPSDTLPDMVETVPDVSMSDDPELPVQHLSLEERDANEYDEYDEQEDEEEMGDDFDEFVEEQDDMGDDDFGDFDDGFQEPSAEDTEEPPAETTAASQQHQTLPSVVRPHT